MQFQSNEISAKKQHCGQTLVGVFSLVDACRSGALEAIEELKLLGVRSVMLTGDSSQVAMYVQSQVWLQKIYSLFNQQFSYNYVFQKKKYEKCIQEHIGLVMEFG